MKELIENLITEKAYVCIHLDASTENFAYGKILACDEDRYVVLEVSPAGYDDGIVIDDIADIRYIEKGGPYDEKMAKLMRISGYKDRDIEIAQEHILEWGLAYALANSFVVSIEVDDSGINNIVGRIEKVEDGICKVVQIDAYGEFDGDAYVRIEDISQLVIDSEEERMIRALNENT